MTKFRKSLLFFGILVLIIGAALTTFIVLSLTGSLKAEPIELEFTVEDASQEYNGQTLKASSYSLTGGYLIEGHTPVVEFTGGQTDAGNSFSGLDVKITDKDGYDVSEQYKIKVNSGVLTVVPCSIQVTMTARDVVYDGAAIDIGNGYTVTGGSLAAGHRVTLEINSSWLESAGNIVAGRTLHATDVEARVIDGNGASVTQNYFVMLAGKVNVVKRPLILTPVSATKVYDGTALECTQYSIGTGSLASGHYVVPRFEARDGTPARVIAANPDKPLEIVAKAVIYDINGDEVTDNYELLSNVGYLTVRKASLTVAAKSASWIYDGKEHSVTSKEADFVTGLADGERVEVSYSGTVTDVAVTENRIESCVVLDGNGNETSGNYVITLKDGKLEVAKAPFTVKLSTIETEYGEPFTGSLKELYSVSSTMEGLEIKMNDDGYFDKLLAGLTEIGNSTYTFDDFEIMYGGEPVTDNFAISVIAGNIRVKRRTVSFVNSGTLSKVYDGNFVFPAGDGVDFNRLADGHRFVSVTCAPVMLEQVGNTVSADILSFSIVDALGNSALGYYDVVSDGKVDVCISARELEVSTSSVEKEYDGEPLDGGTVSCGLLAAGDRLVSKSIILTDAGEQPNKPEFAVYNSLNENVTGFYGVVENYGTIKIAPKPITVYIDSEIEYTRDMNTQTLFKNIRCDGASADYFGLSVDGALVCGNTYNADFYWKADEEKESNYAITESNKKFTIIKRRITAAINTAAASKNFDNQSITRFDLNMISPLDEDSIYDKIALEYVYSNIEDAVDAGKYSAEIVYESDCERVTVIGSFEIKPISVTVSAGALTAIYNGLPYQPSVNDLKVATGSSLDLKVKSYVCANSVINAGQHYLAFKSVDFISASGESISSRNVTADLANSKISVTIEKRKLNITLDPLYGKPDESQNLTGIINIENLANGDSPDYGDGFGIITFVDNKTTFLEVNLIKIIRDGVDVTTNYDMPEEGVMGAIITG